ncbi:cytochrome c family protein (plasmid) [Emticicia oligotrophica DSM 17448]|uniref:Cytochrome c family protein n=1 Tax=Emticicia oligotrophica (strain DSM 17448 / CIP 109782 / MTCC 6937 / GPTSA100-15) TaxID=929562 RepID=A0ABM5N893_EMTOG|nr:cytochrome c3 family protein [Emticicia oligotrophica]AFK05673.1 cytochrome c family protein [Emticicia oligotrophica DSM 17448]
MIQIETHTPMMLSKANFSNLNNSDWLTLIRVPLICLFFTIINISYAQLSPGKLSKAHAKLEGISNCTQCHSIGDKVSNQKCLACHKELNVRVAANKGFHVSAAIKGKECIVCHSEHHELNFDMIRFDKKTFNHKQTGFELKGAHKTKIVNCNECHKSENIVVASLKSKPKTFLGLDTKCLSCHEDYHKKTLSSDCASCHNQNEFKPATLFNHNNADFTLKGAHKTVDCASCHKTEVRNGDKFTKYSNIPFNNCSSCHKDTHKGKFGGNCEACHTEDSFTKISPTKAFNHTLTGYHLEGKHREINCKKCHEKTVGGEGGFQEFSAVKNITCITCHKDIHEGKLGQDCKSCHNEQSFLLKNKSFVGKFDHDKTDYPLEGKHEVVDCKTCHKADFTDPLPHNTCMNCHNDKHNGDFATKKDKYPDCATCHRVEGFSPSNFTIEQHNKSKFKLVGAHLAQPCFACHLSDKKWTFNNLPTACVECHQDIHAGKLEAKFYGKESCSSCHNTNNWQEVKFDHKQTAFALIGSHTKVACGECHTHKDTTPPTQIFKGVSTQCSACHQDVHGGQFKKNNQTDCARCHTPNSWKAENFNHNKTNFKLDGKHQTVSCEECHKETLKDNKEIRSYKIAKYRCVDCHL